MIEYKLSLASSGAVKTPGSMDALQLGYSRNCGIYRLRVSAARRVEGDDPPGVLAHAGRQPPASLVEDGVVEVPALVTAVPAKDASPSRAATASAPSPVPTCATGWPQTPAQRMALCRPPGTPAWQQLVGQLEGAGADVEKSAARAETAQSSASDSAAAAARSLKTLQEGIASGNFKGREGRPRAHGAHKGPKGDAGPQGPKGRKRRYRPGRPAGATGPASPRGQTGAAGKAVEVDATLAVSGAAADAKAVGSALAGKAAASHTHSYAGSSSAGGTANSVNGFTFAAQTARPRCRRQPCHQQGAHRVCVKGAEDGKGDLCGCGRRRPQDEKSLCRGGGQGPCSPEDVRRCREQGAAVLQRRAGVCRGGCASRGPEVRRKGRGGRKQRAHRRRTLRWHGLERGLQYGGRLRHLPHADGPGGAGGTRGICIPPCRSGRMLCLRAGLLRRPPEGAITRWMPTTPPSPGRQPPR